MSLYCSRLRGKPLTPSPVMCYRSLNLSVELEGRSGPIFGFEEEWMVGVPTVLKKIIVSSLIMMLLVGKAEAAGPLRDTIRNLFGPAGIILEPGRALPGSRSRAGDFQASSQQGLEQLNDQITSTFGVASFNSSVTGFTFDLERGVPIRTTESFGPLLTE